MLGALYSDDAPGTDIPILKFKPFAINVLMFDALPLGVQ
jgi:hypothetical protein